MNTVLLSFLFFYTKGFSDATVSVKLTSSSDKATVGVDFTFTCTTNARGILFHRDVTNECIIGGSYTNGTCVLVGSYNVNYKYTCDNKTGVYNLTIPNSYDIDTLHESSWKCSAPLDAVSSSIIQLYVNVPITLITITAVPIDKNPSEIISDSNKLFSCKTNAGRPSSRIQWYISGTNITGLASPQADVCNAGCNGKVISSSELTYSGNIADDGKTLYCTALNIEGKIVTSENKSIVIWYPPKSPSITQKPNGLIDENEQITLTCEIVGGNPLANIAWQCAGTSTVTPTGIPPTTKSVSIVQITATKSQNGQVCTCTGSHPAWPQQKSTSTTLQIGYAPASSPVVIQTPSEPVIEGTKLTLTCELFGGNPLPTIAWQCNDFTSVITTVTPPTDKVVSIIERIVTRFDEGKECTCTGQHPLWKLNKESKHILNVFYSSTIQILNTQPIILVENNTLVLICAQVDGNPRNASFVWYKSNAVIGNIANYSIMEAKAKDAGNYTCTGSNGVGRQSDAIIEVNVLYSPRVSVLSVMNLSTIPENGTSVLQCTVQSNPPPTIVWTRYGSNAVLQSDNTVFQSNLTVKYAKCLDTSNYTCKAMNFINNEEYTSIEVIKLFVTCSPRRYNEHDGSTKLIGLAIGQNLTISEHILAYPMVFTSWIFKPDENSPGKTVYSDSNCSTYKISDHHICFTSLNFNEYNFGLYTVVIVNDVGKATLSFKVNPQGPPNQPTDILVACEITSMIVSWRPGLNGGNEQSFRVVWLNIKTQQIEYSSEIMDSSQEQTKQYIVKSLVPDTTYIICVEAANKHGIVRSTDNDTCTTRSSLYDSQPNNSLAMSVGAGIGSSVFILLVAGLVVLILKRRLNNKEEKSKLYQSTDPGTCRQKTSNDQHNYCELQTTRMDPNPDGIQSNSSNTYEEIGRIKDGQDYQNVDKYNKESREKHDTSTLYANMKI